MSLNPCLSAQLGQLGNVVTTTKQHLYPSFPELPETAIRGHGGYIYGQLLPPPPPKIDNEVHDLYEEIPRV